MMKKHSLILGIISMLPMCSNGNINFDYSSDTDNSAFDGGNTKDTNITETERCQDFIAHDLDDEEPITLGNGEIITGNLQFSIEGDGYEIVTEPGAGEFMSFSEVINGITTFDDSFVVAGMFANVSTFGNEQEKETTLTAYGNDIEYPDPDGFVAKYDEYRKLEWIQQIQSKYHDDNSYETLGPIISFKDGSVVVRGEFLREAIFSKGTNHEVTLTTYEPDGDSSKQKEEYLAKYDKNGVLEWARLLAKGAAKTDNLLGIDVRQRTIAAGDDASIIVTGIYSGNIVFEPDKQTSVSLSAGNDLDKLYIAKFSTDGDFEWAISDGSKRLKQILIETQCDNSITIMGYFESDQIFGDGTDNRTQLRNTAGSSTFVARYAPDGKFLKAFTLGYSLNPPGGLAAFKDGTYLAAAITQNTAILFPDSADEQMVGEDIENHFLVLTKLDRDDRPVWISTGRSVGVAGIVSVTALPDGSSVISGYFNDQMIIGEGEENETTLIAFGIGEGQFQDSFVARYYSDGRLAWARAINGVDSKAPIIDMDMARATAYVPEQKTILVGGEFWGNLAFDIGDNLPWSDNVFNKTNGYHDWYIVGYGL